MNTRKQVVLSAALVVAAAGAVGGYGVVTRTPAAAAMTGHVHGAAGAASDSSGPKMLSISEERARRIGVAYAIAHRSLLDESVHSVGTIAFDETRQVEVDPKIDGWVDRLYVDYTGAPVRKGQPLMAVYSPMLVSAQEELILARHLVDQSVGDAAAAGAAGATNPAAENARELLAAARRRLSWWDIPADEIARIERTGQTTRTLMLRAPADGVVTEKDVVQGARIMPGNTLFKIADLATVWLQGEVFEKDLALVRVGQDATVTLDAYPGETFHGRVAFIAPSVDLQSRTGTVRVELPNPADRLKPGMYAALDIHVPARTPALVVPRTAVLSTGERNIVFVRHADGMLMPHEVTLGHAVGDTVAILSGLPEGATVVASAAFLVDAESNLGSAMQSMPGMEMGPTPAKPAPTSSSSSTSTSSSSSTSTSTSTPSSTPKSSTSMPGMDMSAASASAKTTTMSKSMTKTAPQAH